MPYGEGGDMPQGEPHLAGDVIHQECSISAPEVEVADAVVLLLAGRVPDLELHRRGAHVHQLCEESTWNSEAQRGLYPEAGSPRPGRPGRVLQAGVSPGLRAQAEKRASCRPEPGRLGEPQWSPCKAKCYVSFVAGALQVPRGLWRQR